MEEILASIRKIVADDVPPAKAAARAAAARPAEPAAQPAATRTQKAQPAPASAEAARNGSGNPDLAKIAALISPAVQAEAAASFDLLNQAVFGKTTRTIEDVVLDLMRPMLQKWLDANLPSLVERLVRQEIERISGHI